MSSYLHRLFRAHSPIRPSRLAFVPPRLQHNRPGGRSPSIVPLPSPPVTFWSDLRKKKKKTDEDPKPSRDAPRRERPHDDALPLEGTKEGRKNESVLGILGARFRAPWTRFSRPQTPRPWTPTRWARAPVRIRTPSPKPRHACSSWARATTKWWPPRPSATLLEFPAPRGVHEERHVRGV